MEHYEQPQHPMDPAPPVSYMGMDEPASKWPTAIGTISIVLGSIGLLCYGCNSLSNIASPMFSGMIPPEQRPPDPPAHLAAIQISQLCIAFLLSLWLLIAGIGLVKRRRWSRSNHIAWAFAKILISVVSAVISFVVLEDFVNMINDQMSTGGQTPPFTFSSQLFMIILIVSIVWYLIYPIFVLIWFSRATVKAEVQQWR